MPEVQNSEVEKMSDDERERAAAEAVDATSEDTEVIGFATSDP